MTSMVTSRETSSSYFMHQKRTDGPNTEFLGTLGFKLVNCFFWPTRIDTVTRTPCPAEEGNVDDENGSFKIDYKTEKNWVAHLVESTTLWKGRAIRCILAIVSAPFIPLALIGLALVHLCSFSDQNEYLAFQTQKIGGGSLSDTEKLLRMFPKASLHGTGPISLPKDLPTFFPQSQKVSPPQAPAQRVVSSETQEWLNRLNARH